MPNPPARITARSLRRLAAGAAAICLSIGAVGLTVGGCGEKPPGTAGGAKPAGAAVTVTTGQARLGQVQRTVQVVGDLRGEEDAIISNKVPGRLIAIYRDVGDRVDPGEPLAQLLRNDYILSVNQKRSALLESLAKLGVNDVPGDGFDVAVLSTVRRAKQQSDNSEGKFNRGKQLYEQKPPLISQQDFEDLRTVYEVAKSNFDVETATAQGLIGEARTRLADLRVAEQALADSTIKAPSDNYAAPNADPTTRPGPAVTSLTDPDSGPATKPSGDGKVGRYFVARRFASVGELSPAISRMFRLVDDDPLKLMAAVPERYYRELAIGQPVKVRIDAYPDAFAGQVTRISPQVDEANRTFPIEVQIPNADHKLPPGAFARATINTRLEDKVVLIPWTAVVSFAGVDKVFVIADSKAREAKVTLGDRIADEIEVKAGLKGTETLAISGTSRLATGVAVQAKAATQPASRPATGAPGG